MSTRIFRLNRRIDPMRRRLLSQLILLAGSSALGIHAQTATARSRVLDSHTEAALAAWFEALVPGATTAAAVDFVNAQLGMQRDKASLTLRYLDWPGPYRSFYEQGVMALDALAMARHGQSFANLTTATRDALVGAVATGEISDWQGPPPGLFYFATRADAIDVVYGTSLGFARLGVPYRAHIMPSFDWPTTA